jgi:hypothetical protein
MHETEALFLPMADSIGCRRHASRVQRLTLTIHGSSEPENWAYGDDGNHESGLRSPPGRTVLTTAGSHASHPASFRCPRVRVSALKSWAARIARLVAGQNGAPRRLTLSRGAFALLGDFVRKLDRGPAGPTQLPKWAAILAGKLAVQLHCSLADLDNEITEATMRTAIALAECLLRESALPARGCVTEQEGSDLEDQLDRMEEKMRKLEPVRFRKLRKSYPVQDAAQAIFEELVRRGRARHRQDGLIETVPKANQA